MQQARLRPTDTAIEETGARVGGGSVRPLRRPMYVSRERSMDSGCPRVEVEDQDRRSPTVTGFLVMADEWLDE